jgi:formylglycine-generating enzyme required for sulfatase activity
MYCRVCDIDYSGTLRFCKWCGGGLIDKESVGTQYCPACGSSVHREWLFCNECGVDLASLGAQPKDQVCPACSASVRKGWMFCRQCGEQVATERAELRCEVCGAGVREGWSFCKQCGAGINAARGKTGKPAGGAASEFATVVGVPAIGTEKAEEPFSDLATGDLPTLDEVIAEGKKRPQPTSKELPGELRQGRSTGEPRRHARPTGRLVEQPTDGLGRSARGDQAPGANSTIVMGTPAGPGTGAIPSPPTGMVKPKPEPAAGEAPPASPATAAQPDALRTVAMEALPPQPPAPPPNATVELGGLSTNPGSAPAPSSAPTVVVSTPEEPASAPTVVMPVSAPAAAPAAQPPYAAPAPAPVPAAPAAGGSPALKWVAAAVVTVAVLSVAALGALYFLRPGAAPPAPEVEAPRAEAPPTPAPAPTPAPEPAPPPTPQPPPGMVYVPAGSFMLGADGPDIDDYSKPAHRADVKAFFIDETEVTNSDYEKFVQATGRPAPKSDRWQDGAPVPGSEQEPVTGVTWFDAAAYAQWAGKRLPTEAEWEFAARGADGRLYPWGSTWNPSAGNFGKDDGAVAPVGTYPAGSSPFGVLDMIGNAWEWTASDFRAYPGSPASATEHVGKKVMRGGAFDAKEKHNAAWRGFWMPNSPGPKIGFRCVKDAA